MIMTLEEESVEGQNSNWGAGGKGDELGAFFWGGVLSQRKLADVATSLLSERMRRRRRRRMEEMRRGHPHICSLLGVTGGFEREGGGGGGRGVEELSGE